MEKQWEDNTANAVDQSDPPAPATDAQPAPEAPAADEEPTVAAIEGTLDQITRSVQSVTELIREGQSAPVPVPDVPADDSPALADDSPAPAEPPTPEALVTALPTEETPEPESPVSDEDNSPEAVAEIPATVPEDAPAVSDTPVDAPRPRRSAGYSRFLVVHHNRDGKNAEEYRALRTSLFARYGEERMSFLVTSAEPGEGKTVTSLNLGLVLAERQDRRTVVVDLDLRKNRMAQLLGAAPGPGVAEVLSGRADPAEIIQPTEYPNLFFIPGGRMDNHPAGELLGRTELRTLVDRLRHDFDYALFDTPAVNRYSDTGVAGLAAGEALLVVRLNKTPQDKVEQAIRLLRNANVAVIGIVMTHGKRRLFH